MFCYFLCTGRPCLIEMQRQFSIALGKLVYNENLKRDRFLCSSWEGMLYAWLPGLWMKALSFVCCFFGSEIKKYRKCHFFNYYIKHTRQSHPTPEPSPVNCSNNMESDVDEILFKFPYIERVLLLNHLLHN